MLQKSFDIFLFRLVDCKKLSSLRNHFQIQFSKLTSILFEATIVIVFRLSDYLHVSSNFHLKMFIEICKRFIQQIIVSRFRLSAIKIDNSERHIRNNSYLLSFYSIEWLLNRTALRNIIQRFDRDIVVFRATLTNLKSRSFSFSDNSLSKSFVFKNQRFRFLSSRIEMFFFFSFLYWTIKTSTFVILFDITSYFDINNQHRIFWRSKTNYSTQQ